MSIASGQKQVGDVPSRGLQSRVSSTDDRR